MNYHKKRVFNNFLSKLDIRVLLVFILIILIGLFIFLYQMSNHVNCSNTDFIIDAQKKQVGEYIEFYDKTPNAKKWKWDFGDGTKEYKKNPLHKYEKPGIYTISLEINGNCKLYKTLEIRDLGKIMDSMKIPKIMAPKLAVVGQPVEFYYNYKGEGFSWEWSFGESGQMDNTSEFPAYTYSTPGRKKITLVINGDVQHIATRDIIIKPRKLTATKRDTMKGYVYEKNPELFKLPPGPAEIDPLEELLRNIPGRPPISPVQDKIKQAHIEMAPEISEYKFELLLLEVAKQSKTEDDFLKYTCGKTDFPVIKNGKNMLTFTEFCNKIKGKTIKIESLRLSKNNRNCIENITINYKVKKLLVWYHD